MLNRRLLLPLTLLTLALVGWLVVERARRSDDADFSADPSARSSPALESEATPRLRGDGSGRSPAENVRRTVEVEGIVLDARGAPVADVEVQVWRSELVASTRSDADGRFAVAGLPWIDARAWYGFRAVPEPPAVGSHANFQPAQGKAQAFVRLYIVPGSPLGLRVVDGEGSGIAANVDLRSRAAIARGPGYGAPPHWFVTDRRTGTDGRLHLDAVPAVPLAATVEVSPDLVWRGLDIKPPFDGEILLRVGVVPECALAGRVLDGAGLGVARAKVSVQIRPEAGTAQLSVSARSGADGKYRFDLPAGTLQQVLVDAEGFLETKLEDLRYELDAQTETDLDITLVRGSVVRGRVVDEEGRGIDGATVHLRRWRARDLSVETSASGAFTIENVPPGRHPVRATKEGWWAPPHENPAVGRPRSFGNRLRVGEREILVGGDGTAVEVAIILRKGVAVRGVVVHRDGRPGAGARVHFDGRVPRRHGLEAEASILEIVYGDVSRVTTTAGKDGTFSFPALAPSSQAGFLWACLSGFASEGCEIETEDGGEEPDAGVRLVLKTTATVAGRVLRADGEPAADHLLQAAGLVRVDALGRFRIEGLGAGEHQIGSAVPPHGELWRGVLAWGEAVEGLELRLPAIRSVSGVLLDEAGNPLAYQQVWLRSAEGRGSQGYVLTNGEGAFVFDVLAEAAYEVSPTRRGEGVRVEAGQTGVRIRRRSSPPDPAPVCVVEGRVTDPAGAPLARGRVSIAYADDEEGRHTSSKRGAILGGRFRLRFETRAESVTLTVTDPRDALGRQIPIEPCRLVDLAIADSPFAVKLRGPGHVAGQVVDEAGQAVAAVRVRATDTSGSGRRRSAIGTATARTDAEGRFRFEGLAHGPVEIQVQPPPAFFPAGLVNAWTGDTNIVVQLERGSWIGGTVLEEDGSPAAGVPVSAMPATHPEGRWAHAASKRDGSFRLEGLDHDTTYTVRTGYDQRGARPDLLRSSVPDVRPGTTDVVLVARRGVYLEGTVHLPGGQPAPTASVWARAIETAFEGEGFGHVRAGADGRFRLGPVAPGRYEVHAHLGQPHLGPSAKVDVEAPGTGLRLELASRLRRAGRVLDRARAAGGESPDVEAFRIAWIPADGEHAGMGRTRADAEGKFEMGGLEDRAYVVYAWRQDDDRFALARGVRPSEEDLVLSLEPGLGISGRVDLLTDVRGKGYVEARLDGSGPHLHIQLSPQGRFAFRGLSPGRWSLTYRRLGAKTSPASVAVEAGTDGVVLLAE